MTANRAPLAALLLAALVALFWRPGLTVEVHVLWQPAAAGQTA